MARQPRYAYGCTALSLVLFAVMTWAVFGLERFATLALVESVMVMACAGLPGALFVAASGLLIAVCAADAARLLEAREAGRPAPPAPRGMRALATASATGGALSAVGFLLLCVYVGTEGSGDAQVYKLILYGVAGLSAAGAWSASRSLFLGYDALAACMRGQAGSRGRSAGTAWLQVALAAMALAQVAFAVKQFLQSGDTVGVPMLFAGVIGSALLLLGVGSACLVPVATRSLRVLQALRAREEWLLAPVSEGAPALPEIPPLTGAVRLFGLVAGVGASSAALAAVATRVLQTLGMVLVDYPLARLAARAETCALWLVVAAGWIAAAVLLRGAHNTLVALVAAQETAVCRREGGVEADEGRTWTSPLRSRTGTRIALALLAALCLLALGSLEHDRVRSELGLAWVESGLPLGSLGYVDLLPRRPRVEDFQRLYEARFKVADQTLVSRIFRNGLDRLDRRARIALFEAAGLPLRTFLIRFLHLRFFGYDLSRDPQHCRAFLELYLPLRDTLPRRDPGLAELFFGAFMADSATVLSASLGDLGWPGLQTVVTAMQGDSLAFVQVLRHGSEDALAILSKCSERIPHSVPTFRDWLPTAEDPERVLQFLGGIHLTRETLRGVPRVELDSAVAASLDFWVPGWDR